MNFSIYYFTDLTGSVYLISKNDFLNFFPSVDHRDEIDSFTMPELATTETFAKGIEASAFETITEGVGKYYEMVTILQHVGTCSVVTVD